MYTLLNTDLYSRSIMWPVWSRVCNLWCSYWCSLPSRITYSPLPTAVLTYQPGSALQVMQSVLDRCLPLHVSDYLLTGWCRVTGSNNGFGFVYHPSIFEEPCAGNILFTIFGHLFSCIFHISTEKNGAHQIYFRLSFCSVGKRIGFTHVEITSNVTM